MKNFKHIRSRNITRPRSSCICLGSNILHTLHEHLSCELDWIVIDRLAMAFGFGLSNFSKFPMFSLKATTQMDPKVSTLHHLLFLKKSPLTGSVSFQGAEETPDSPTPLRRSDTCSCSLSSMLWSSVPPVWIMCGSTLHISPPFQWFPVPCDSKLEWCDSTSNWSNWIATASVVCVSLVLAFLSHPGYLPRRWTGVWRGLPLRTFLHQVTGFHAEHGMRFNSFNHPTRVRCS